MTLIPSTFTLDQTRYYPGFTNGELWHDAWEQPYFTFDTAAAIVQQALDKDELYAAEYLPDTDCITTLLAIGGAMQHCFGEDIVIEGETLHLYRLGSTGVMLWERGKYDYAVALGDDRAMTAYVIHGERIVTFDLAGTMQLDILFDKDWVVMASLSVERHGVRRLLDMVPPDKIYIEK